MPPPGACLRCWRRSCPRNAPTAASTRACTAAAVPRRALLNFSYSTRGTSLVQVHESPRLLPWDRNAKRLALASLVQAFLFSLLNDSFLTLRSWLLDQMKIMGQSKALCYRTQKNSAQETLDFQRMGTSRYILPDIRFAKTRGKMSHRRNRLLYLIHCIAPPLISRNLAPVAATIH